MYYKNNKLNAARKRTREELLALGWKEMKCMHPTDGKQVLHPENMSPHIDDSLLVFEDRLKRINTGETKYALECYSVILSDLPWTCMPGENAVDTLDAFREGHKMIVNGIWYPKGIINVIDREHPEKNAFEFVQGWRGARNDGFGWDFVLMVNAIPVGAIVMEEDEKGCETPCEKALNTAWYQLDSDYQFPVFCHHLVVSNGKQVREGNPWLEAEDMQPAETVTASLSPMEFLEKKIIRFDEE